MDGNGINVWTLMVIAFIISIAALTGYKLYLIKTYLPLYRQASKKKEKKNSNKDEHSG